jgi:hypothetical protein
MRVQPWGGTTSVRYGYVNKPFMMTRLLPSESRNLAVSSGLLPSEYRMARQEAGLLPSQGRAAFLTPQFMSMNYNPLSLSAYAPSTTIRYGNPSYSSWAYSAPVISRLTPTMSYGAVKSSPFALSSTYVPTWSIRYGKTRTSLTSPTSPSISTPYAAPAFTGTSQMQLAASPATAQTSSVFRPATFSTGNSSIRYGQTGINYVPR